MRTPGQMADALEKIVCTLPYGDTLHDQVVFVAADLRALAALPTGEDAALVERGANVISNGWTGAIPRYADIATALRDLAARLATQQSTAAEEPKPAEEDIMDWARKFFAPFVFIQPTTPSPWEERREIEHGLAVLVPSPALLALIEALNRHKSLWKAW